MSTFINQKTFTNALTFFCIIVFIQFFVPQSLSTLNFILKYVTIISSIIILMIYYKLLDNKHNPSELEKLTSVDSSLNDSNSIEIQRSSTKELYKNLTSIVIKTANSINTNFDSAIYITDPSNGCYILQDGDSTLFSDIISSDNDIINHFIHKNKKFHQKDNPDEWDKLFIGRTWRGSECLFLNSIELNEVIVGFVLTYIDHFNNVKQNEMELIGLVSQYVSYGLKSLDSLERYMTGEETKMLILDTLSGIDFKSDPQNIYNQFKYLIRNFFQYDRMTISLRKESENRRKYDKGINSIIKLIDGHKDEFSVGTDFPTNGSLHGLPTIANDILITTNWRKTHNNII